MSFSAGDAGMSRFCGSSRSAQSPPTTLATSGLCRWRRMINRLTSSSATGNLWSTGATTQSIAVSVAGSYTVTVTNLGPNSATNVIVGDRFPTNATFVSVIGVTIYISKNTHGEISEFGAHRSLWRI